MFVPTGWSQGQVLAVKPGKNGEVLDANGASMTNGTLGIAWKSKRNVPKKPALLLLDGLLYGIDDNGVATCWEAATGKVFWNERVGGNYSASPVAADGRIYFCSEEGKTTVVAAGRAYRKLAENQLGDGFMASPAIVGTGSAGLLYGSPALLMVQLKGVLIVGIYSFVVSYVLLKFVDVIIGLRVSENDERIGLDITQHREVGYTLID